MKGFIKNLLKRIFSRFPWLRRFVSRLNGLANGRGKGDTISGIKIKPEERNLFTSKALYSGYSVEYLNARALTKKERACELKKIFYSKVGYYLDLDNPKTFNQKIQWLKLNYLNPAMPRCVDKAEFKNYIDEQLGKGYTVPNYGAYENENDIDFDALPNKFVLKSNVQSDARHILLITDKTKLDIDKAKTVMATWLLKKNNLCCSYCSAYWNVTPKIVVEEFLDTGSDGINDYKFYCYNGKCRHFLVCKDRQTKTKYINYDMNFNCIKPSPNSYYHEGQCEDIDSIKEMIKLAEKLAAPFPFVRVDFYDVKGKIYVGELTFYPGGGYNSYSREWDEKFGEYLVLPETKQDFTLGQLARIMEIKLPVQVNDSLKYKRVLTQSQYCTHEDVIVSAGWYNSKAIINEALKKGALAIFCNYEDKKEFLQENVIAVEDPLQCVQNFERWKLKFFNTKLVTITGSVGKTTTTGLINTVFSSNFNTLTGHSMANSHGAILRNIQKLKSDYKWWIQEVGGVQPGYIESSALVLNPDIVILTNIGDSHLNTYITKENIFYDKSSLERCAKKDATVIVNYDDDILRNANYTHKLITCSINNSNADYYAKDINMTYDGLKFTAVCNITNKYFDVNLKLFGKYNAMNALFAIAAGDVAGIPIENIVKAIEAYQPSGMRQNFINIGGFHIMVDAFNAEPKTVLGSAITLTEMPKPKGKKIFITGHIDKLGTSSAELHEKLGHDLAKLDIDTIILFAGDSKFTYKALCDEGKNNALLINSREELDDWMRKNISRDDIVFFKSGQFEAALVKSVDNVFGTTFQNEQQFNEGEIVNKDGYKIRIRRDNIAEIEGYIGSDQELILPDNYEGIPILRIRPFAFSKNTKISSVIVPDSVVNIGREAFYQCTNIKHIVLPQNLKIIEKNAFNYNKNLTNIVIPKGTIHIDRHAFFDCVSLEKVYLPKSIGFMGEDVFGFSNNLKHVNLQVITEENYYLQKYMEKHSIKYEIIKNIE